MAPFFLPDVGLFLTTPAPFAVFRNFLEENDRGGQRKREEDLEENGGERGRTKCKHRALRRTVDGRNFATLFRSEKEMFFETEGTPTPLISMLV